MTFFLLTLAMPAAALTPGGSENDPASDAYVSAGSGDARILIPFLADDVNSSSINAMVYNGLTKTDKDLEITGDLAESWDISEDGLEITFHLRKDVRWHDGYPFTSRDVKFTFDTILDPATGCPYISGYSDIESIDVMDPYTIKFRYARPYAPALLKLGMGIVPEHLFSKESDVRNSPYARAPVGTGPYIFKKWESGRYIVLEDNPHYFEHPPRIGMYVYRVIPDEAVRFLELVSGGVDSSDLSPYQYLYRSDTPEFKARVDKYEYLSRSYTYVGYNLKDPVLSDVRVRKALSYALDKDAIINASLLGLGEPTTGPFLRETPYYDHTAAGYGYDPGKARELLREAGWRDSDGDGILEKQGRELVVDIATNQGNKARERAATIIQDQWSDIGVKARVKVVAWAAFLDQFIKNRDFQAVILGWTIPVDPDLYAVWHSDSDREGGLNFVSYSNPEADRLIEEGRAEFDPAVRVEIYRHLHRILAEDVPYTFLFVPYATPAVNKRFRGIEPAPAGIGYNFIDWYVPEDEVKYKL